MTQEHWLTLKPQSPVCIGLHKAARFISSRDEIPGSVLRGALARHIKIENGADHILEIVSKMRFGFFRPSQSKDVISLPLPLTAQQCKRNPGFGPESHGIFDMLIPFIAYEEMGRGTPWLTFDVPFSFVCRISESANSGKCGSKMEQARGYYIHENNKFKKVEIEHVSQTKVSIDRRTKSAKEGMLFAITGVSEEITFSGRVWGPEEHVDKLKHAIERFGIGALTGRGFGNVKVERRKNAGIGTVGDRVEQFNKILLEVWNDISSLIKDDGIPQEIDATYFTVDLLSPAILRHPVPTTRLTLTIKGVEHEPVFWFTEPTFVGGWSPALGLPKNTHLGADIGSTYVFKTTLDMDTLVENLEELEAKGVGSRSNEGYGETMICHPFHLEVTQV